MPWHKLLIYLFFYPYPPSLPLDGYDSCAQWLRLLRSGRSPSRKPLSAGPVAPAGPRTDAMEPSATLSIDLTPQFFRPPTVPWDRAPCLRRCPDSRRRHGGTTVAPNPPARRSSPEHENRDDPRRNSEDDHWRFRHERAKNKKQVVMVSNRKTGEVDAPPDAFGPGEAQHGFS